MKFGELKSKIEKCLTESYSKNSTKKDLFVFKELVLKNKNISRLFYLYDELSSKKGLSENVASEYVNQCTTIFENAINKITNKEVKELIDWTNHVKSNNDYSDIDNLFSHGLLNLESKIRSKKIIVENLQQKPNTETKEVLSLPLKSISNVANKTIKSYISNLNENEQKEVLSILNTPKEKLQQKYEVIKEVVCDKLESQKENSDTETKETINQVINKLTNEEFNVLNFFKVKNLLEGL
jgi:hypothetical protein